ncbi:serine/threonine-protein kinase [Catenibacillus scindens]|uniref:Serine/threonine-protein kinase n=1 Tax=Catenibacillus scindens TaxID=673271 RepID=A0A7W8H8F0_9FIRM|nr:serine/threonine-protein kinase [Catenibacillus scindens]MBB5263067.1 serine/threonine-protein kinase [Catenibacillus scindens]
MLQIGSVVDGKYKVLNKIGQGGMSVVYLSLNERANKTWAIKEIRKDGVQDFATVRQGLIAETNILKSLNHKYLPSIVDVIDDKDTFLIVMDYIQGKSLNTVLKESLEHDGLPIFVEDVISWGKQLCDVLYYLHTRTQPIIYRDMKPANVMLKPDGEICVVDFGTARVFKTGNTEDTTCLGTPGYAAPEQYGGNGQTRPQTDIYNLGATLHHLITGRNPAATPFNFPKITQCRPTLLEETPRDLRGKLLGLEMIIDKCTQYEIKDRYQSCVELKYDLEHPEELGLPYRKLLKKKFYSFVGCGVMALILGGVSLVGMAMENNTTKSGCDYYIQSAQTAANDEKIQLYRSAIALNPTREDAYLDMLDTMVSDNVFSSDEDVYLTSVLNSRDNGRDRDNRTYLQANRAGYVEFSYQLGLAYYYSVGNNGDKSSAVGWFQNVIDADMDSLDMGDNDEYKYAWQARAQILGRISDYYKNKIGVTNKAGDAEVSYADYWNDLMSLFDSDAVGQDNMITDMRLYSEIVFQIYSRTVEFKDEAGISQEEMEQALDAIQSRMDIMAIDGDAQAMELAADIETMIEQARRSITATFATNPNAGAGSAASQSPDSEGGSQEADSEEGGGE